MHSVLSSPEQCRRSFIETARRAQIIECAIDCIAELGFAKASLAQIAKRAGVSTGVTLYYFADKEELIRAVVAHIFAMGEAFIRPRLDLTSARIALHSFIEASVAFMATHHTSMLAMMNIARAGRTENGAPRSDPAVKEPRAAGFHEILEAGQASGEFRPFSVAVMTASIIASIEAIPLQFTTDPNLSFNDYAQQLVQLFDRATRQNTAHSEETSDVSK